VINIGKTCGLDDLIQYSQLCLVSCLKREKKGGGPLCSSKVILGSGSSFKQSPSNLNCDGRLGEGVGSVGPMQDGAPVTPYWHDSTIFYQLPSFPCLMCPPHLLLLLPIKLYIFKNVNREIVGMPS
jgi:hypothetical protein